MAIGFALYGHFALTFSLFQVKGDALVYFNLLRRFFGEKPDFSYAYQFGSTIWNAPFVVGKSLGIAVQRGWAYPVLVLAAAFSVAVAFVHDIGYDGVSERDSLSRVVEDGYRNRHNMRLDIQNDAKARWAHLWGLLEGRDSLCINEPLGTTDC